MMSKRHSGRYYIGIAEKGGCRVETGKGSHCKVYAPANNDLPEHMRPIMVIPVHDELAKGTESAIVKWFAILGLISFIAGCIVLTLIKPLLGAP